MGAPASLTYPGSFFQVAVMLFRTEMQKAAAGTIAAKFRNICAVCEFEVSDLLRSAGMAAYSSAMQRVNFGSAEVRRAASARSQIKQIHSVGSSVAFPAFMWNG